MALAAVLESSSPLSATSDRAFGDEAIELRSLLESACSPPMERSAEALKRLTSALVVAEQREGMRLDVEVFQKAVDTLRLLPSEVPLPRVAVESEDEIGLDWDNAYDNVLSVTIDRSRQFGYSGIVKGNAAYGTVLADGRRIPATLLHFLRCLHGA